MSERKIYMDYGATTPVDSQVLNDMMPYFSDNFGNPSSVHQYGEDAQKGVIAARQALADFLGADTQEIVFTSGATEGNNTVIKGIAMSRKIWDERGGKPHIIVSEAEHDCVLDSAKRVAKDGLADVSFVPVEPDGRVRVDAIMGLIRPETALVSVMYANNETGAINPISEIGRMIAELNASGRSRIYFHTDAAQAVNYLDCGVKGLHVDLLTMSSHKIYGPKGVGALYVKKGTPIAKFMDGGEQEFKLRAGTHNTAGIVGFGSAISRLKDHAAENEEIMRLRDRLIDGITASVPRSALNGRKEHRLPNNANIRFEGAEGEAILVMLSAAGVSVSTGSACAAKSLSPSHVLKAMGLSDLDAHSSIRFSLGRGTTEADVDYVISIMPGIIEKLRSVSGSIGAPEETGEASGGNVFWSDDVLDRGGLPADLGCEKNRKPESAEGE